jgi:hydroxyacylglutathione hydrolase
MPILHRFKCRTDNIGYLLCDETSKRAVLVDAPELAPILQALNAQQVQPTDLLITHQHPDHIAAVADVQRLFPNIRVYAPKRSALCAAFNPIGVGEGDILNFGNLRAHVLDTAGHSADHVSYVFPNQNWLFCGDTLFKMGCGRVFDSTPEQLATSLLRLIELPQTFESIEAEKLKVLCGHDYMLANMAFALSLEPQNSKLHALYEAAQVDDTNGVLTAISTLAGEILHNPFLTVLMQKIPQSSAQQKIDTFKSLRAARNIFAI